MKNLLKYTLCAALTMGFAACSEDYLDTTPESSAPLKVLFASPSAAQYAVNGLGRLMAKQYLENQGSNGEGTMMTWGAEYPGDGMQRADLTGWAAIINSSYIQNNTSIYMYYPWYYYYRIILNANQILANIPANAPVDQQLEYDYVKAQALTYRAYSYFRLTQSYCRRWSDKQGQSRGVILRLEPTDDPMPPSTLAETYEQIYKDLDEAIKIFESSSMDRGSLTWQANADVAHAIYSRAALTREDWATAVAHSQVARKGYSIMGLDDYTAGFNTPNKEWIWNVYNDDTQTIYYYSFFAMQGANSSSSLCRGYPCVISKQIVDQIDPADSRLSIFCIPTAEELAAAGGAAKVVGTGVVTKGAFFNRIKKEFTAKGRLYNSSKIAYYTGTKFLIVSGIGDGCVPIFRAAEMIYNEAEAQFKLGKEDAVRALLNEATKPYNANYNCTKSGQDLWNEIVALRKFDLWGEGFSFYDLKRWGAKMDRKTWAQGGNWSSAFATAAVNVGPEGLNNWTIVIPVRETDYNNLVVSQEDPNWTKGMR